jgi:hypothetical protein
MRLRAKAHHDPSAVPPGSYMAITNAEWERTDRELARATVVLEQLAEQYGLSVRQEVKHPRRAIVGRRGFWEFQLGLSLDPETVDEPEHRYELVEGRVWHIRGFFTRGSSVRALGEYGVADLQADEPLMSTAEAAVAAWPLRRR